MSFLSEIYSVLNGETASNAKNSYIIETTDPRSTVEEVRLYEPQRVSFTSSSHEDTIASAMVELSGTRWDQKTDAKVAITEAVNAYIKNAHTESSWKTFGRLIELAHNKFNFDMQEELKKYNQDQIDLLDMKEAVKVDADIRAGLGGDPALKDLEIEVHDIDGPRQPQDIWKGEISRKIVGDEIENMGDEPYEKKALKKESTEFDESKMSELHAMIKDGKSAKEIAKEMKLDEKTIAQLMKGMKEIKEEELDEALNPKDKKVVDAFYAGESMDSKILSTDGKKLEKSGIGGQTIATSANSKFKIVAKMDSKSTQEIVNYIKKSFPKDVIEELQTESKLQKLQKLNTPKEG